MNESRVYDWNDEINNEDSGFTLLPEGDYEFMVEEFERAQFDGSDKLPPCRKAIVTIKVFGENDNATIIENFLLCSQLEWKLSALFLSVGMKKHGEPLRMNWPALPGHKGRCHVYIDNYIKKDGTNGQSNKIKKFYAYDDDVQIIRPAANYTATAQPVYNQPAYTQTPQYSQPAAGTWQAGKF